MVYLKKTLLFLSLLFLQIQGVFAGYLSDNLGDSLKNFSDKVLENPDVMYFLFFMAIFFGTFTIFKLVLKFIFKSNDSFGDTGHDKASNVVAFMFSFIGTSGIFFLLKDKDPTYIVTLLGGSFGILIVILWAIVVMKGFIMWANTFEENKKIARFFIYALGIILSFGSMVMYLGKFAEKLGAVPDWVEVLKKISEDILFFAILGAIVAGFILLGKVFSFGGGSKDESPEKKNRKSVKENLHKIATSTNNSQKIIKDLVTNLNQIRAKIKSDKKDQTTEVDSALPNGEKSPVAAEYGRL